MNILYIWDADYPWDVRVEKICNTLSAHGHEVHIASRNLKRRAVYEQDNGLHVHRLNPWRFEKINYMMSFPAFFSPVWRRFLDRIITENHIGLIIVRDLPMAIAAIRRGKSHGLPVIFDMAEDYVSLVRDIWGDSKFKGLNLVVRNPYLAKLVELYTFKHIDHTLVVVDEAKAVVSNGGGRLSDVSIVANTPDIKLIDSMVHENKAPLLEEERYSAIYIGGIQLGRGIQIVFEAIPRIIKEIPEFQFVVIGDGYASGQLQRLIQESDLKGYVQWLGWVDHKEIFGYIAQSNVGVIPHYTSNHVDTTIPNKIFDYMACALPVVASDAKPMKRIIEKEKCGVTFRSGDAEDFADKIIEVYRSDMDYGANGRNAVESEYNWANDESRLLKIIAR